MRLKVRITKLYTKKYLFFIEHQNKMITENVYDARNEEKKTLQFFQTASSQYVKKVFIKQRQIRNVKMWINVWVEQNGKSGFVRPVLVIKKIWALFFCVPLTSKDKVWDRYYTIEQTIQKNKTSTIILSQWRTFDKKRFFKHV